MIKETLYIKAERNVKITKDKVLISDIGKVYCTDSGILSQVKALQILDIEKAEQKSQYVISILKIIEVVNQIFPQVTVVNLGETDVIVEIVKPKNIGRAEKIWYFIKVGFVCCICFFGTAFTIMAFHNDIGITSVFDNLYFLITGKEAMGITSLEVFYSLGLSAGIVVFYNHIGKKRITNDPTPIEVEMRIYEEDVDTAIVESNNREGNSIDVD